MVKKGTKIWSGVDSVSASSSRGGDKRKMKVEQISLRERIQKKGREEQYKILSASLSFIFLPKR